MILLFLLTRLLAVLSLAIPVGAAWLIWSWREQHRLADQAGLPEPGDQRLWIALALITLALFGRFLILALLARPGRAAPGSDEGRVEIRGADGAILSVRTTGASTGPILVLTHGWGLSSRIWADERRALEPHFGVTTWDLPGSGRSGRPKGRWSLEGFAGDLKAVVESLPADRPVVLVGHSIGGMTVQTLCGRDVVWAGDRIAGLVLENTTFHNPLRTMAASPVFSALQPLIVLVLRLDIAISPLIWLMNWQAYLNGSTHLAMRLAGFGSRPAWGDLDLCARLPTLTSPAVQAHGNLAMIRWSVAEDLANIRSPTLVFIGERDLVTRPRAGAAIAQAVPKARLVSIPGAGHLGPVEKRADYLRLLTEFAARHAVVAPDERKGT
ncbi:MAG: alpha/beta fold hydrolase [Brevundimonas sp.]|uniref:alpha/beta fold hydrolase n=1 Tax=Brevundimonas sp. TaxID=1871086 RepID=UPI0039187796